MQYKNIFLIGMMLSGKSTVGRLLSKELNMKLCDTDKDIEDILDMNITNIFNQQGEKKFRQLESVYFQEHALKSNCIYSLGGGIVLDAANRLILKKRGLTIFLDCSIEELCNRAIVEDSFDSRPLINNDNIKDFLTSVYVQRYPLYKQSADIIIKSDKLDPNELVMKIIKEYK